MAVQEQPPARPGAAAGVSRVDLRSILVMTINPAAVLKQRLAGVSSIWALSVSGAAFTLFFLQTGLDLFRTGKPGSVVAILAAVGLVYGTAVVAAIAAAAFTLTRLFGGTRSIGWSIKAFALGYSPALIYATLGLLANTAFHWKTAIAFGVTGMLWALGPMIAAIKEMTGQMIGVSIVIATLCGGLLLVGWSVLSLGIGGMV